MSTHTDGLPRIAKERYYDPAYAALEWSRMWTRVWLLAAHVSELPDAGSVVVFDVGRESILVVRQADGAVRAFFNVCQHRGNRLVDDTPASLAPLRCRYHHWAWNADGSLRHVPRPQDFPCGVPADEVRLREVPCGVRLGFVWVALRDDVADLDAFLAPVADHVAAYRPEALVLRDATTVEVACNWKTSADVSNESYHLPSLHPELAPVIDLDAIRVTLCGPHSRMEIPLALPRPGAARPPATRALLARLGVPANELDDADPRAAATRAARARLATLAVDAAGLADDQLVDKHQVYVFPNVQLNFSAFTLELYRHRPVDDPERCLFDEFAFERPGLSPARGHRRRRFRHGEQPLGAVMGADVDLLPGLQRGMRSEGFRGLYLSRGEGCIANMHAALDAYLGAER